MNFVIEHIGKILKSDVRLDGITVIAGPNGSGKSTIGRVLMTWLSALRQLQSRLVDERLKSAREAVDAIMKANGLPEIGLAFSSSEESEDKLAILRSQTWFDVQKIAARLDEFPEYFFDDRDSKKDAEKIVSLRDVIGRAMNEVIGRDSSYYLPAIFEDSFETAFGEHFLGQERHTEGSLMRMVLSDDARASVHFSQGKPDAWEVVPADKIPFVFYFEPVHLLDLYANRIRQHGRSGLRLSAAGRYMAPDVDWRSFLYGDVDRSKWSVERKKKQEEIEVELDALLDVIRGQLEKQDRELLFVDKDVPRPVPVMNAASGIKTMAAIEKGIRAGVVQPGCILIIDEPESNLHPHWQIEFAHFLVKLSARFDMRLLLNTHSPFFLKAVEVFSREEGCGGTAHYYHMVKDGDGLKYVTKELTDGTNEVFKTYFDAMNDLMSR